MDDAELKRLVTASIDDITDNIADVLNDTLANFKTFHTCDRLATHDPALFRQLALVLIRNYCDMELVGTEPPDHPPTPRDTTWRLGRSGEWLPAPLLMATESPLENNYIFKGDMAQCAVNQLQHQQCASGPPANHNPTPRATTWRLGRSGEFIPAPVLVDTEGGSAGHTMNRATAEAGLMTQKECWTREKRLRNTYPTDEREPPPDHHYPYGGPSDVESAAKCAGCQSYDEKRKPSDVFMSPCYDCIHGDSGHEDRPDNFEPMGEGAGE